jgi:hypothetical protein
MLRICAASKKKRPRIAVRYSDCVFAKSPIRPIRSRRGPARPEFLCVPDGRVPRCRSNTLDPPRAGVASNPARGLRGGAKRPWTGRRRGASRHDVTRYAAPPCSDRSLSRGDRAWRSGGWVDDSTGGPRVRPCGAAGIPTTILPRPAVHETVPRRSLVRSRGCSSSRDAAFTQQRLRPGENRIDCLDAHRSRYNRGTGSRGPNGCLASST